MKKIPKRVILPAATTAGSILCLLLITTLTSPINNIGYAMLFFFLLLAFLVSLGYLVTSLQFGQVSSRAKLRIVIISCILLVAIMLRSVQSLTFIDLLVVVLISFGLLFYSSRRS